MIAARRSAFRQRLLLTFLVVLTLAAARQILISPSHGQDFRDFYAAATLMAQGGNPYDPATLAREQDRLYNQPDHLKPGDRAYYDHIPYPQGPWVALAIVPSTVLPWQAAYILYLAAALAALATAAWAFLRLFSCSGQLLQLGVAAVLMSPVAFINLFQGQPVAFLVAAFAGAWMLLRRGRPWLAGALLAAGWIKPHIGLPLLVIMAVLEPASVRKMLAGFGGATAVLFGVATLVMHASLLDWPRVVISQWSGPLQQADLASINAFYYPALSAGARQLAVAMVGLAAAGYVIWTFRTTRAPLRRGLTLLVLTLLAAPYAHSYDALLLLPVVVALLGPEMEGWRTPAVERAVWAFAIFPLFYFAGLRLGYFNGFTAIPVLLLAIAWHQARPRLPVSSTARVAA